MRTDPDAVTKLLRATPKPPTGSRRGASRIPQPEGGARSRWRRRLLPRADVECRCRGVDRGQDWPPPDSARGSLQAGSSGRGGFAKAVALADPPWFRAASALRHGHRSSARPHDASREPLAGWNGRLMAQVFGGGDLARGLAHGDWRWSRASSSWLGSPTRNPLPEGEGRVRGRTLSA